MDEIFGEMNCRFGSDSIMMKLLKSSMDKAHERLKSKDGPIERLNEKSKFYELAIIQLEGSLKLVQEETDSYILESSHEILSDLMEIKDRLRRRLKETKLAIVKKDEELKESSENEFKLRRALALKEKELASLGANFEEAEKPKKEGANEGQEGDIGELKFCVDQQVWNIKQKLEDERMNLTNENKDVELNGDDGFEVKSLNVSLRPEQNMVIERVSSDIDILKGTLDVAFEKMQNAEVLPLEKQWRCNIEKDTVSILIRGFMGDFQQNFKGDLSKRGSHGAVGLLDSVYWPGLVNEMTSLRRELEALSGHNEVQVRKAKGNESSGLPPRIQRANSEPLLEVDYTEDHHEEDSRDERSHYVAKMVKNHESIIRKQREELQWLKREILREKGLSGKRDKDPNGLERRIREVIVRLDNVIQWNPKSGNKKGLYEEDSSREKRISKNDVATNVCEKDLNDKIRKLEQETDDLNLRTTIREEAYMILLKGLMRDFCFELCDYDTMSLIRDDICLHFLKEEIYYTLCSEAVKEIDGHLHGFAHFALSQDQEVRVLENFQDNFKCVSNLSETIRSSLKENEHRLFFREMVKAWKMERDGNDIENLIREEIYQLVIVEAVKDANVFLRECEAVNKDKKLDLSLEIKGEENSNRELNSLLRCFEVEEDLMLSAISEIKEHNAQHDLVGMECEEPERVTIEWLLTEEVSTFSSVSSKIEKALQQLIKSKTLLRELGGIAVGDLENVQMGIADSKSHSFSQPKDNQVVQFSPVLVDLDQMPFLMGRLEEMKHQVDQLVQVVPVLRKRELLYRKAFVRRCHNLKLAETEVDLLGDQVDALLGLLEKIHLILEQYSPILSGYFKVADILKLIKKELTHGASHTPC
ncbi:WPP domain-associated protein [Cornus florida]|uniref:WPP domain-associated protein n=1 Tax=Cornus florida TaxID=4283 RepID=UPI00289FFE21|nr:WPP domain-associated protein [Cornus florida]